MTSNLKSICFWNCLFLAQNLSSSGTFDICVGSSWSWIGHCNGGRFSQWSCCYEGLQASQCDEVAWSDSPWKQTLHCLASDEDESERVPQTEQTGFCNEACKFSKKFTVVTRSAFCCRKIVLFLQKFSDRNLQSFSLGAACGMEYLSQLNIIHCDLAARNCMQAIFQQLQ